MQSKKCQPSVVSYDKDTSFEYEINAMLLRGAGVWGDIRHDA